MSLVVYSVIYKCLPGVLSLSGILFPFAISLSLFASLTSVDALKFSAKHYFYI